MIKAMTYCTNCKKEQLIPREELMEAVALDDKGEYNLCSACRKLWTTALVSIRTAQSKRYETLRKKFGII